MLHALRRTALVTARTAAAASLAGGVALAAEEDRWTCRSMTSLLPTFAARCEGQADASPLLQQTASATPLLFSWGRLVPASSSLAEVRQLERTPIDVSFWSSRGLRIQQMCFGTTHGAVLDDSGKLWAWSEASGPMPVQLPVRTRVASIASTDSHLYAITSHGRVLEWKDVDGQLQHQHQAPIPEPTPLGGALA